MGRYSPQSTSTTSNSSSDSHSDRSSNITAHIGEIDEASPLRSREPQNREHPEHVAQPLTDDLVLSSTASQNEDDAISYDSTMERIRNEVWEKVREAKLKRKQKQKQRKTMEEFFGRDSPELRKTLIVVTDTNNSSQSSTEEPSWPFMDSDPPETDGMAPQSIRGSFEKRHLQDINMPLRGTAAEVRLGLGRLVIEENMPESEFLFQKAINKKYFQDVQDEEIESAFESILAINLNEPMAVLKEESPSMNQSVSSLESHPTLDDLSNCNKFLSESVLSAKIFGSMESTLFYVPMSLVEKRENEMFQRAYKLGIGLDQWNGSLLSRRLKNLYPHCRAQGDHQPVYTLELYPEAECADANYSHDFRWLRYLHEIIESFYKTGIMRVPDFCLGSDILTALEYFGILYDPDQLIFDSFSAYLRVKLWSEYFTQRETMAAWVTKKLEESQHPNTRVFSTCPFLLEEGSFIQAGRRETEVLDGGLSVNLSLGSNEFPSSIQVHGFFNGGEHKNMEPTENIHSLVREDFCRYFQKRVPGTNASFPTKLSIIHHPDGTREKLELATLYIQLEDPAYFGREDASTSSGIEEESEYLFVSDAFDSIGSSLQGCHFLDATETMAKCKSSANALSDRAANAPACNLDPDGPEPSHCNHPSNLLRAECHDQHALAVASCKSLVPSSKPESRNVAATAPPPTSCNSRIQATLEDIEKNTMTWLSDKPTIACTGTSANDDHFNGDLCKSWRPTKSPACVSTSSCMQFKNSEIPDTWMSWHQSIQDETDLSLKSESMISTVFHDPPFSSSSKVMMSKPKERSLVPLKSDHVYEDLLVQDADVFFGGWGGTVVPNSDNKDGNSTKSRSSSKVVQPNDDTTESQKVVCHAAENQVLSYNPSDFVCDMAELFDDPFSVEPEDDSSATRRIGDPPTRGQTLLRFSQGQQQLLRSRQKQTKHVAQTAQKTNMLYDYSETDDNSTAISSGFHLTKLSHEIIPSCRSLVPGIDFPDDEK